MWAGETDRAVWLFASRCHPQGRTLGAYENFNVALHVGDNPSAVQENRALIATHFSVAPKQVVWPLLEHTTTSYHVQSIDHEVSVADILYTSNPDIVLTTMSADCVPVIAIAKSNHFILTAHIGWRGAANNIAEEISMILSKHTDGKVDIMLGPAICGNCYQVDQLRFDDVVSRLSDAQASSTGLDLRKGLETYFENKGVTVCQVGSCTFETPDLFSFRRDGVTGRQAAAVKLR